MAKYVLRRGWQAAAFRRSISVGGERRALVFTRKQPVELSAAELAAIEAAGGAPIEPARVAAIPAPGEKPKKGK